MRPSGKACATAAAAAAWSSSRRRRPKTSISPMSAAACSTPGRAAAGITGIAPNGSTIASGSPRRRSRRSAGCRRPAATAWSPRVRTCTGGIRSSPAIRRRCIKPESRSAAGSRTWRTTCRPTHWSGGSWIGRCEYRNARGKAIRVRTRDDEPPTTGQERKPARDCRARIDSGRVRTRIAEVEGAIPLLIAVVLNFFMVRPPSWGLRQRPAGLTARRRKCDGGVPRSARPPANPGPAGRRRPGRLVHAAFTNLGLRRNVRKATMMLARCAIALLLAGAGAAVAGELEGCLSQEQRRAVIASRQAIPLGKALRAAKARLGGEVVRARLCKEGSELVYVLTVLAHDGKVTLATIDGTSGAFIDGR